MADHIGSQQICEMTLMYGDRHNSMMCCSRQRCEFKIRNLLSTVGNLVYISFDLLISLIYALKMIIHVMCKCDAIRKNNTKQSCIS